MTWHNFLSANVRDARYAEMRRDGRIRVQPPDPSQRVAAQAVLFPMCPQCHHYREGARPDKSADGAWHFVCHCGMRWATIPEGVR